MFEANTKLSVSTETEDDQKLKWTWSKLLELFFESYNLLCDNHIMSKSFRIHENLINAECVHLHGTRCLDSNVRKVVDKSIKLTVTVLRRWVRRLKKY